MTETSPEQWAYEVFTGAFNAEVLAISRTDHWKNEIPELELENEFLTVKMTIADFAEHIHMRLRLTR